MVRNLLRFGMLIAAGFLLAAQTALYSAQGGKESVDVELVIAVDVSYSMDPDEQALQREGYADALTSRAFVDAIRNPDCTF